MSKKVTFAVDAHGGDHAPSVVLKGIELALSADSDLEIALCGRPEVVEDFCMQHDRCEPIPTTQIIEMGEHPANAVRTKTDSSIVVGCKFVREGKADGFFSAGSTGACLASGTLNIGRIKGIKRPALGVIVPAFERDVFLLDVGANADCKVEYILQFAQMGTAYMQRVMGVEQPRVGLLNIGEEDTKGSTFAQEANACLREKLPNFFGNCEGGDLTRGEFDVVVTDGFTGNVALKTLEGTAKLLLKLLKGALTSSAKAKLGAALVKSNLDSIKEKVSPDTYGGSPLLGLRGACLVGHGSSSPEAIKNGILTGCREVRGDVVDVIAEAVGAHGVGASAPQTSAKGGE